MNPRVVPLSQILTVNDWLYNAAQKEMSDEHLRGRVNGQANSFVWIAGHLAGGRSLMAKVAGVPIAFPYEELYQRGAPHPDPAQLPDLAEVNAFWTEVSGVLTERLGVLTDTELDAEPSRKFPGGDNTVLGGLAFLCLHDSYHLGQLGYLRVLHGYPAVVG